MRLWITLAGAIVFTSVIGVVYYVLQPLPPSRLLSHSHVILGQSGQRLSIRISQDGYWREPAHLGVIDPKLIKLLVTYEDKRFWSHPGVDFMALARSVFDLAISGRVVSGASTLTMQTARLMYPDLARKNIYAKIHQMLMALRLELHLSKKEILEAYFTLAPYGGNIEGIQAASWVWLNRSPKQLTYREAAFFVALPQSPEARRPDRHKARAEAATSRVLETVAPSFHIEPDRLIELLTEPIPFRKRSFIAGNEHLVDRLSTKDGGVITTSIYGNWQRQVQSILNRHIDHLPSSANAAALIIERKSGLIRSYVGSTNYSDKIRKGANNFLTAVRSPGSTLKPLIYGMALDRGILTSSSVLSDTQIQVDGYRPTNFKDGFMGAVSLREALVESLNIPAIATLKRLGPKSVTRVIGSFVQLPEKQLRAPGLSLAVGGLNLSAEQLATLYLGWIDQPSPKLRFSEQSTPETAPPIISRWSAKSVMSLLSQTSISGRRYAMKTGTSNGGRDVWSIHILKKHLVLVWAGSPDNDTYASITGRSTAAPIGFEIVRTLGLKPPPAGNLPTTAITKRSVIQPSCPRLIEFPENEEWIITPDDSISVGSRYRQIRWYLNGTPVSLENNSIVLSHKGANVLSARRNNCITTVSIFAAQ